MLIARSALCNISGVKDYNGKSSSNLEKLCPVKSKADYRFKRKRVGYCWTNYVMLFCWFLCMYFLSRTHTEIYWDHYLNHWTDLEKHSPEKLYKFQMRLLTTTIPEPHQTNLLQFVKSSSSSSQCRLALFCTKVIKK